MNIKRYLALLTLLASLLPGVSHGEGIAFVTNRVLPAVRELAKRAGAQLSIPTEVIVSASDIDLTSFDAVVLVGPATLAKWKPNGVPAVAVFISRAQTLNDLGRLESAIFLEPPVVRQVRLAKALIGEEAPIGILSQSVASLVTDGLDHGTMEGLGVLPYYLDDYGSINRALVDLLDECYVLVGQYDTTLYSAENIKNILITAYRQNRPLIGPSSAYIRAGSLATTYSDIEDVSKRLVEIIRSGMANGQWPAPGYNPYFKVRYNEQVARSLNLTLPEAEMLAESLAQRETK